MKRVLILIVLLIATALLILVFAGQSNISSEQKSSDDDPRAREEKKDALPSFSLKDFSGNTFSNGDFSEKILVVNSWATWCPFCKDELPDFISLQKEFPNDIVVIAIDRSESLEKAKGYTDENNISEDLLYLLDPNDSFYQSIGGFSMPETIFANTKGEIVFHKRGPMELSEMREKVKETLDS